MEFVYGYLLGSLVTYLVLIYPRKKVEKITDKPIVNQIQSVQASKKRTMWN